MQNPNTSNNSISKLFEDQVTRSWEAYGNKDVIFYQHLEPFDKAQEKLSLLIAQNVTNAVLKTQIETTAEFLTYFMKSVLKVRIKMEKFRTSKEDIAFIKRLDEVINTITAGKYKDISLKDYSLLLFKIGMIYERLGYSRPEREHIRTGMQSDMEIPGTSLPEEMSGMPVDYSKNNQIIEEE